MSQHDEHLTHHQDQAGISAGMAMRDPVCGMEVKPDSPHETTHDGNVIRFCSAKCLAKFETDPQRYLAPAPVPEEAAPAGTEYTCPMHPEVRQVGPGTCPKCGMALEPVLPELEAGENPELADFRRRFWWTLPLTVLVTLIAMSGGAFVLGCQSAKWRSTKSVVTSPCRKAPLVITARRKGMLVVTRRIT